MSTSDLHVKGLVERLQAIGEEQMYSEPATTKAVIDVAATALLSLSEKVDAATAEVVAEQYRHGETGLRAEAAEQRVQKLEEALKPSADTKAAYIGEFAFSVPDHGYDEEGEPFEQDRKVTVPWTTVKEIMAAISDRAKEQP